MGIRHPCLSRKESVPPRTWMANSRRQDPWRAFVMSPSARRSVALAHRIALSLSLALLSLTGLGCAGLIAADPLSLGGHPSITTQPTSQTIPQAQLPPSTVPLRAPTP